MAAVLSGCVAPEAAALRPTTVGAIDTVENVGGRPVFVLNDGTRVATDASTQQLQGAGALPGALLLFGRQGDRTWYLGVPAFAECRTPDGVAGYALEGAATIVDRRMVFKQFGVSLPLAAEFGSGQQSFDARHHYCVNQQGEVTSSW